MKTGIILFGIALVLFLLSRVRVGGGAEYSAAGLSVKLKIFLFDFTVYPFKKRKKVGKQKQKKEPAQPSDMGLGGSLTLVKELLPVIAQAAGQLRRKVRVDRLMMDLTWGDSDPARCALGYGYANGAVGVLWPMLEQSFCIKDYRIRTAVDFQLAAPTVYLSAVATLTVGQCCSLGVTLGIRFLKIFLNWKKQESITAGKKPNTTKKEAEVV